MARGLPDLGDGSEGKPFLVRFFDHLRRIVSLFNEKFIWNEFSRKPHRGEAQGCAEQNDRGIWQKWLFRSRLTLSPTGFWLVRIMSIK